MRENAYKIGVFVAVQGLYEYSKNFIEGVLTPRRIAEGGSQIADRRLKFQSFSIAGEMGANDTEKERLVLIRGRISNAPKLYGVVKVKGGRQAKRQALKASSGRRDAKRGTPEAESEKRNA